MRPFNSIILIIILTGLVACHRKKTKDKKVATRENSEETIRENPTYASVGLTKLSDYHFFKGKFSELNPSKNVIYYELNSMLFSDYARKKRFISLPEGEKIHINGSEALDFPVGTVLIKNFYYGDDQLKNEPGKILETRLLMREENGWKALPYIWNKEQTEAYLEITGGSVPIFLINQEHPIDYGIPTMLQCKSCHEKNGAIQPIGPSVRQLNRKNEYKEGTFNQLSYMHQLGWIEESVDPAQMEVSVDYSDPYSGTTRERARAYLDVNCGHCHRPEGPAKNSGLNLRYNNEDLFSLGVDKGPVAAGKGSGGLMFDIVPGQPDASILVFRMNSTDPAIMMPELGRKTIHKEGIELIRKWIEEMD